MTADAGPVDTPATDLSMITTAAQFAAVAPEWSALLDVATPGDELHHDPQVIAAMLAKGEVEPRFVVVRRNGRIHCIAPFVLQPADIRLRLSVIELGAVRARALRLLGDQLILRKGEDPDDALRQVFQQLHALRASFDVVWIYTQRTDLPLWRFLSSSPGRLSFRPVVVSPHAEKLHGLAFEGSYDDYLTQVRSKPGFPGKTIRRFWRDAKDGTATTRVTAPDQVADFLRSVDQVYNASWQARTYGTRKRDDAGEIEHLTTLASLGFLRSYLLTDEGMPIAFVIGYQYRGRYWYAETGYDSSRSSVSPGSVLTHAAIEDLFRWNPPRELDFGFGDGAYKRIFGNISYDVCSLYVVRRGRWRLLLGAQQTLNAAYEVVRAAIVRAGLDSAVRRRLKRQVKAGA